MVHQSRHNRKNKIKLILETKTSANSKDTPLEVLLKGHVAGVPNRVLPELVCLVATVLEEPGTFPAT